MSSPPKDCAVISSWRVGPLTEKIMNGRQPLLLKAQFLIEEMFPADG